MKFKRYFCLFLVAVILFSFSGCNKNGVNKTSSKSSDSENDKDYADSMDLLYNSSDTFNPYTAKTDLNRQLCKLIFEPLVKTDNEFNPVNRLAQKVDISGNKCTVVLKSAVFSDGSGVSASDVVYSFNLAKASDSYYASKLNVALSASVSDGKTVVFTMANNNPYFANLLDFPILKSGSEKKTDSNSVVLPPIGCGRYYVSETRDSLLINENFYGKKGSIKTINLINAPDKESVSHFVEIGATDIYYSDAADSSIIRMSAKKFDININNIVYIGINQNYGQLSNSYLRYAISSAIDRQQICTNAYFNNAIAATGFFNPLWEEVKSVQNIKTSSSSEITVENLKKIGYNSLDSNSGGYNSGTKALQFTLLVNSENSMRVAAAKLIASQLSQFGIIITVVEKDYAGYVSSLQSGNFQLYLGEVAITEDMDLSQLIIAGGTAAFGAKSSNIEESSSSETQESSKQEQEQTDFQSQPASAEDVIKGFYAGKNTITDVATILQAQMPFVPVCYRTGALFCNEKLENVKNSSLSDIYFSIENYSIRK